MLIPIGYKNEFKKIYNNVISCSLRLKILIGAGGGRDSMRGQGIGGVIEEGWKRENEVVGLAEFGLTLLLPQIIS